ncbi:MAG: peptide synthetase, partial [Elusimicrobia bacterium]|nr:peptide synthetase [Elusimicrobiota bacterium]
LIASDGTTAFDALTGGDGASIGSDTMADGGSVEGGRLRIAPVSIGRGVWIGNRCSVGGGVVMEDASGLGDLSMLPDRTRVPAGELWQGSPARPAGRLEPMVSRPPWNAGSALAHLVGVFLFPLLTMGAIFPGLMVITHLGHQDPGFRFLVAAPLVAASFVFFLCLEVWAFKRLLLGRLREGRYPVGGGFYARKWFFDQMMDLSLEVTGTLYTTMYLAPWLRALGARLGPRSEISTIRFLHPDLLSAGAECFLADDVLVGGQRVRGGFVDIGRTRLGDRTFVGNSAILPAGVAVGSNVLIGTLSAPPASAKGSVPDGTAWFGSPAILLPARQKAAGFSEEQTYRPPPRLVALRLFIEFFRVLLPSTIFVACWPLSS